MKAIVLSAGLGTRLYPITKFVPKPGLTLVGKTILERTLNHLIAGGINPRDIVLVLGPEEEFQVLLTKIREQISSDFLTTIQRERKGTGHAVQTGLQVVDKEEAVLVINGDVIFERDTVVEFIKVATFNPQDGLLAVQVTEKWEGFGVVLGDSERISGIAEKPESRPPQMLGINAGLYYFPPEQINAIHHLPLSIRGEIELTDLVSKNIESGHIIKPYLFSGYWADVGKPWDLLNAHEFLMESEQETFQVLGTVEEGATLIGNVHVAKTARVRSGAYVEGPTYIDEGADIGPNCYIRPKTYLGKKTRVGNACEIKNSILFEGTHVAHLSYVGDSLIGRYCNLGAGTITANLRHDNRPVKVTIKGKRLSSGRRKLGAFIGDYVKTGIGVSILPGVIIGEKTWIGAGLVVERDIPANKLVVQKLETKIVDKPTES